MYSHITMVAIGHSEYIQDVIQHKCNQMHTIGTFLVAPYLQVSKLKVNETSFLSVTLSVSLTPNGDCSGRQFSDSYCKVVDYVNFFYLDRQRQDLAQATFFLIKTQHCQG